MIEPFLKWPGGKRWLTSKHRQLFPAKYKRYVEPFLGGGAVFFSFLPADALLSDCNGELINVYNCIMEHHEEIERGLARHERQHNADFYYRVRGSKPRDPVQRAIRFLYLNRTCFNGIYRVNLRGVFNVPIGSKTTVSFPDGHLTAVALALKKAKIIASDFEPIISQTGEGDFVYADPPYTIMHSNNGFVKYNAKLFSWPDQTRLATALKAASERGALVMLSNADHASIRGLYRGFGNCQTLSRHSVLSGDSAYRRDGTEVVITNYPISTSRQKKE